MTRKAFYAEYYKRTNEQFADEIINGKESREKANRKKQRQTSKSERIFFLFLQYALLVGALILLFAGIDPWSVLLLFCIFCLPITFLTDFSLLKIELLYHLYRPNHIYARLLHQIFLGQYSEFIRDLHRATPNKVSGYWCIQWQKPKFYGKFRAVCRNPGEQVILTFGPRKVKIRTNSQTVVLCDKSLSREALIDQIAAVVNTVPGKKSRS